MFTHILIPIDGSELSERAVKKGVAFAREIGARVTAFHVTPKFPALASMLETFDRTREEYAEAAATRAKAFLRYVLKTANAADVPCEVAYASGDNPFKEIIKAAETNGCDLILMASHGRRGVESILRGSETQKVLTHSRIPVLVYR